MALDDAALKASILAILDGSVPLPSAAAAGDAWGEALHAYSVAGVIVNPAPPGIPSTGLPAALPALKASLGAAFSGSPGTPSGVAGAITSAFTTYWATAVFAGATPPTLPTGGGALTSTLTSIFSFVGGTHDSKATEMRDALAAFTKLVSAVFPGPAPPPGTFFVT
jgi:hypothetical protein